MSSILWERCEEFACFTKEWLKPQEEISVEDWSLWYTAASSLKLGDWRSLVEDSCLYICLKVTSCIFLLRLWPLGIHKTYFFPSYLHGVWFEKFATLHLCIELWTMSGCCMSLILIYELWLLCIWWDRECCSGYAPRAAKFDVVLLKRWESVLFAITKIVGGTREAVHHHIYSAFGGMRISAFPITKIVGVRLCWTL